MDHVRYVYTGLPTKPIVIQKAIYNTIRPYSTFTLWKYSSYIPFWAYRNRRTLGECDIAFLSGHPLQCRSTFHWRLSAHGHHTILQFGAAVRLNGVAILHSAQNQGDETQHAQHTAIPQAGERWRGLHFRLLIAIKLFPIPKTRPIARPYARPR